MNPMMTPGADPSFTWLLLFVVYYAYTAYFLMRTAKRLDYPYPWLAWVPFANMVQVVQLAGYSGWWTLLVFLSLIPFVGPLAVLLLEVWVFSRIAKKVGLHPAWALLFLIPFIGYPVVITMTALAGDTDTTDDTPAIADADTPQKETPATEEPRSNSENTDITQEQKEETATDDETNTTR